MLWFRKKENVKAAGTVAVGCGGSGCNIANRLGKISDVDILTVNTDRKGLIRTRSDRRILLGEGTDAGCNGDAEKGRSLTKDSLDIINESIERFLNVVILSGLGGGTGTGSSAVIAEAAKKNGSRVMAIVSLPMSFESERRNVAMNALDGLAKFCDILIILDGDRLVRIDPMLGAREAFSVLDQMICESFMSLMELLEGKDGETMFRMMKGMTYTVSFAEGMHAEKVADALISGVMTSLPAVSQPIIFVRGNIPKNDTERTITEKIMKSTGKEPMFVQGPEGRGMNLVMFVPVSGPSSL